MQASGSVPTVGAEVDGYSDNRDEPVVLVEASEIFSGCGWPLPDCPAYSSES